MNNLDVSYLNNYTKVDKRNIDPNNPHTYGIIYFELECKDCGWVSDGIVPEVLHKFLSIPHIKETGHSVSSKWYKKGEVCSEIIFGPKKLENVRDPISAIRSLCHKFFGWFS